MSNKESNNEAIIKVPMIRDKENHTNTITMAIIAVQINFT
jgi:hypothetical protein